jgi:hypothetical protein
MVGPVRGLFSLFAVVVFGGVATATGCGDDDSEAGDYRKDASALCAEAKREAESVSPPRTRQEWEAFLGDTLQFARDYNRRFKALEPPAELADEHARSLRLSIRAERLTKDHLDELAAGDALSDLLPRYLEEIIEFSRRSNELARAMGLPECVVPIPGPGGDSPAPV